MKVVWRDGARVHGVKATDALTELERIAAAHDEYLYPKDVLDAARPDGAVLHPAFEWNDQKAAEQYRLHEASTMVRAVKVIVDERPPAPAYVFVPASTPAEEGSYRKPAMLVQHEDEWMRAVKNLTQFIRQAQRALEDLQRVARDTQQEHDHRVTDVGVALSALEVAHEAVAVLARA